jgi:hypothetical protein
MGDRGNIVMREALGKEVFFYSHWGGSELPHVVQRALARRQRWGDGAYLARIVFCELTKGHERGETGYGISTERVDSEHDDVVLDVPKQTVSYRTPGGTIERHTRTFEQFVTMSELERELERVRY